MLRIVADENIPLVREAFGGLGEVRLLPGRAISRGELARADVLLVRSVTRVGAELLEGTPVRFVGTATIGTDHIDLDYLRQRGSAFADAAGANANSVAEYVLTAILLLAQERDWDLAGMSLGIVGVGNIGTRVERYAGLLGMRVLPNDPPRQRQTPDPKFVRLEEALQADIVTFHVPLNRTGLDASWHLLNQRRLADMRPATVIINTSRGPVVDNAALKERLEARLRKVTPPWQAGGWRREAGTRNAQPAMGDVILDVWENEPAIDAELLGLVRLGTPHIAGYSYDGKLNGTVMLYRALARFSGLPETLDLGPYISPPEPAEITLETQGHSPQRLLGRALGAIYPMERDDAELRRLRELPPDQQGKYFDELRKNYPVRREAGNYRVKLPSDDPGLWELFRGFGFK